MSPSTSGARNDDPAAGGEGRDRAAVGRPREPELLHAWQEYLASRPGQVSVAMYDAVADVTVARTDPAATGYETASTVKAAILAALLERAGPTAELSERERSNAHLMISVSDNNAASRLWRSLGGTSAMGEFFERLGMRQTTAGTGGRWGLTRTTAEDQVRLLRAVTYTSPVFSPAARAAFAEILGEVVPEQRWGLTAGVPSDVGIEIKNGWLPHGGGWVVSSLAHVHGAGRDYVMAVFTRGDPSMRAGVETIESLSRLAWAAAASRPVPPRTAPAPAHPLAVPTPTSAPTSAPAVSPASPNQQPAP